MGKIFETEIYRPDFPLYGTHLIAASAGTGKTYQLQNIYARLILETDLRVSEILVMTFTKAATMELKKRIHSVLKDLRDQLNGKKNDRRAAQLLNCAEAKQFDRKLLAGKIELAMLEFDNAAISTIHGFCERTLARYAFETGFSFDAELDDSQKKNTLNRMINDWYLSATDEEKAAISLKELRESVNMLNSKTDWIIDGADPELELAKKICDSYETQRKQREAMTFDDLLRGLREALINDRDHTVAASLRREYKAALIDEFQDTDPVQYDIFNRLFAGNADGSASCPLYLVGDPKQAIYSFRSGDIFTYRQAVNALTEDQKYELTTNFRSSPALLAAVNAFFKGQDTFMTEDIPYLNDILSGGTHPELRCDGREVKACFKILGIKDKKTYHTDIASEIAATLMRCTIYDSEKQQERSMTPGDIAVLADTNKNCKAITEALTERSIPCVLEKNGNIFDCRAAKDLHAVLAAAFSGGDPAAVRRALATILLNTIDPDESALVRWTANFRKLHKLWSKSGIAAMLNNLEQLSRGFSGNGIRKNLAAAAPQELADFDGITQLLIDAEREQGRMPQMLISWLEKRLNNISEKEEEDAYARVQESGSDAVRVMTIHKSKGLQFPVVFIYAQLSKYKTSLWSCHDEHGTLMFTRDETLAEEENDQERIRKFYVAMTRAELMTVLVHPPEISGTLLHLFANAENNNAGKTAADSPVEWLDSVQEAGAYIRQDAIPDRLPETPQTFDLTPVKGSYSSLQLHGTKIVPDADDDGRDDFIEISGADPAADTHRIFRVPGGTNTGNCWHHILEKIPFDCDDDTIGNYSARALASYGFDPEKLISDIPLKNITSQMIRKTLDFPLTAPDGEVFTLSQIPRMNRSSEQSFDFSSAKSAAGTGELASVICRYWQNYPEKKDFITVMKNWNLPVPRGEMTGFFDLIFSRNGFYYIVDWKSNSLKSERIRRSYYEPLPGSDPLAFDLKGVTREMAEHWYFLQYLLYSAVLHRWLKQTMGTQYSWERNFGGIRYFFLRGIASGGSFPVYSDRPQEELLDELAAALGMEIL